MDLPFIVILISITFLIASRAPPKSLKVTERDNRYWLHFSQFRLPWISIDLLHEELVPPRDRIPVLKLACQHPFLTCSNARNALILQLL